MPTREEIRVRTQQDLKARGVTPKDPSYAFALQAMEDMNQGMADLDDELADLAGRFAWLAQVPTWVNQRKPGEFEAFVAARIVDCEAALALVRQRWEQHLREAPDAQPTSATPPKP